MEFKFAVQIRIQKPVNEVFDAVHDSRKLSGYFTNGGSAGPLDEGKTVLWTFGDVASQTITVPVRVQKTVQNSLIRFTWAASEGTYDPTTGSVPQPVGYDNIVEIRFDPLGENETLVKIVESGWRLTEGGLQGSYQNCQGWMHMICSPKAYLQYGIDLRKGSF
ncbi:MAG: SRPBCC domain-containing protein [Spirochaetia bacterium]